MDWQRTDRVYPTSHPLTAGTESSPPVTLNSTEAGGEKDWQNQCMNIKYPELKTDIHLEYGFTSPITFLVLILVDQSFLCLRLSYCMASEVCVCVSKKQYVHLIWDREKKHQSVCEFES